MKSLRISFKMQELNELITSLKDHGEEDLVYMLESKVKEYTPSRKARIGRVMGGVKAREKVQSINKKKIEAKLDEMLNSKDTKITITSVSKEIGLAYNTVNKYKDKIINVESRRKIRHNIK